MVVLQVVMPRLSRAEHWGTGRIETGYVFDDNVFQAKNKTESDLIWESKLALAYFLGEAQISASATFSRYFEQMQLNYEQYEIGLEGPFGDRNYAAAFYSFSPTALLDKTEVDLEPFAFRSDGFELHVDRDFSSKLNLGFVLSLRQLRYNRAFSAKDSQIKSISPTVNYLLNDVLLLSGYYAFEMGRAKGGRTVESALDDISYNANIGSVQLSVLSGERSKIRLGYRIERKNYTSESDPFHRGRKDFNNRLFLSQSYQASKELRLSAEIDRTWHFSTDKTLDYKSLGISLVAAYLF